MSKGLREIARLKAAEHVGVAFFHPANWNYEATRKVEATEKLLLDFGARCLEEMRIEIDDCPDLRMDELVYLKNKLYALRHQLEGSKGESEDVKK